MAQKTIFRLKLKTTPNGSKLPEVDGIVRIDEVKKIDIEIDRTILDKTECKNTILKITGADNSAGNVEISVYINAEYFDIEAKTVHLYKQQIIFQWKA